MASSYSPSLKIELIGNGDQSGTWGTTTNNNLGTILEQAITGVQTITMVNADYTLTSFNGVSDEARNAVLVATGTNSAIRQIICPLVEKLYVIFNNTTGGFAITIGGATGSIITIPNGTTAQVYCDGTNFFSSQTGSAGNFNINGNLVVGGTTTLTGATGITGALGVTGALSGTTGVFSGAISSVSPAFTGTPTAPTAAVGTNTTQIATTAFVLANLTPPGAAAGGFVSVQYFTTPGAFTWTRPVGIKKIYVYVIGGGGGGLLYNGTGAPGGGGGGCAVKMIDVTSISSIAGVVGAGGAQSASGSSSTFANPAGTITAGGGSFGSNGGGYPVGGVGGTATGGDLNIPGGQASGLSIANSIGGTGGIPAFFGVAGVGGGYVSAGTAGVYGGGGGGAGYVANATVGGDGIIVVYEYN
jgi:hypothetical protein